MDNTTRLQTAYFDIKTRLDLLFDLIEQHATDITAQVFQLPAPSNEDVGEKPTFIPVSPIEGIEAFRLAKSHYFLHKLNEQRSGRVLPRLPGVVMIEHPEQHDCLSRIIDINRAKDEFKTLVFQSGTDKNTRFKAVSDALPDLVKLQVFRHLLFLNATAQTVGFSWVNRNAVERFTKKKLLASLDKAEDYYREHQPLSDFLELVEKEKLDISRYPDSAQFVIRRPQRISPMMNIRYYQPKRPFYTESRCPANVVAHSPIFIFNHLPKVHKLKTYVLPEASKIVDVTPPIIPRLHLYEVTND